MPIYCSAKDLQEYAIKQSFESIYKYNLCSLRKIPKHIMVNPVTQTQGIDDNICVNYINLSGANESEAQLALEAAVLEEYCGIYGISLERQWPFQRLSCPDLLKKEASERLMNCVVFVLKPPRLNKTTYLFPGSLKHTDLAYYQYTGDQDGFAQERDRSLISAQKIAHTHRVTEIKTIYSFPPSEMEAILVPEHLVDLAKSVFKTIEIIPVPTISPTIKTLPGILSIFGNEKISEPLLLDAPDFLNSLHKWSRERGKREFSLHAVRLHTTFDFTIRPMVALSKNQRLLAGIQGKILTTYADDSGWIMIHKNFGLSKESFLKSLAEKRVLPKEYIEKMVLVAAPFFTLFQQLKSTKGDVVISNIYKELSIPQCYLLEKRGAKMVKFNDFYVITCCPSKKSEITKIIEQFELKKIDAVVKIQSSFRGFWVRKTISEYKEKQAELALAQDAFAAAKSKVDRL